MAARAKVPLVPIALRTDAWGQGAPIKDLGPIDPKLPVDFVFGKPVAPEGKGDAAHRYRVIDKLDKLPAGPWKDYFRGLLLRDPKPVAAAAAIALYEAARRGLREG